MPGQCTSPWTPNEDAFLREYFAEHTHAEMAAMLGRTVNAVRHRCSLLRLRRAAEWWSEEDLDKLRAWYARADAEPGSVQLDDLASELGRMKSNVARKARALGLTNRHRRMAARDERGLRPCDVRRLPKFATEEERRAALAEVRREWCRTHEHPRGALGMRHTPETRAALGEKSRGWWRTATPEQREQMVRRRRETNLERYGTANPAMLGVEEPYSRARGGKREDLDNRYFRSAWEANYCRYLVWLKEQGEIEDWEYEPEVFRFEGVARGPYTYTPDFRVTEKDGSVVYHEVKGWMDGPSRSRLKRMAKHYPDVRIIVIGEEEYKALRKWKGLIPNWE